MTRRGLRKELADGGCNRIALDTLALRVIVVAAWLDAAPVTCGVVFAAVVRNDGVKIQNGDIVALT